MDLEFENHQNLKKCIFCALEQAGTNTYSIGLYFLNLKIGLSLFGCAEKYTALSTHCVMVINTSLSWNWSQQQKSSKTTISGLYVIEEIPSFAPLAVNSPLAKGIEIHYRVIERTRSWPITTNESSLEQATS